MDQLDLVAPAAFTVAEGNYEPGAWLRAIYADDQPVGVLLVEMESEPYLVRFMIDSARQREGIGKQAVQRLASELREVGWTYLETSVVPVEQGAEPFWRRCGFADTGRCNGESEPILRLELG